jgi:MFS family permease
VSRDRCDAGVSASAESLPASAGGRLRRLAVLVLAHAVGTVNFTLVLAFAPAVRDQLGLSNAGFGLLIAAYYGAMLAAAFPAGWLVDRYPLRLMLLLAHALMAAGMLVVGSAVGSPAIALGLFLCGLGYSLINPATARAVLLWFPVRARASAMSAKQTGVPIGGALAALAAASAASLPWQHVVIACAALTVVAGGAYLRLEAGIAGARRGGIADLGTLLRRPRLAGLNAGAALYAGCQVAFFAYLVLYARAAGFSAQTAALALAAAHAASVVGRIAWGFVSDRSARSGRRASLVACGALAAAGLAALPASALGGAAPFFAVVAVLGATLGSHAGLGQTAAVEAVEPHLAGAAVGYVMFATTFGLISGPTGFGLLADVLGYIPAWLTLAAATAVGAALYQISVRN